MKKTGSPKSWRDRVRMPRRMLAVIGFIPLWLFVGKKIPLAVALTLAARRLGNDPGVASAPFITTLIDATGLIYYFLIARAILY